MDEPDPPMSGVSVFSSTAEFVSKSAWTARQHMVLVFSSQNTFCKVLSIFAFTKIYHMTVQIRLLTWMQNTDKWTHMSWKCNWSQTHPIISCFLRLALVLLARSCFFSIGCSQLRNRQSIHFHGRLADRSMQALRDKDGHEGKWRAA